MIKKIVACLFICCALFCINAHAQITGDSLKFDYAKIYSSCLDADAVAVFPMIAISSSQKISARDLDFKTAFEERFKYATDKTKDSVSKRSGIDGLLAIYKNYWRNSLLDTGRVFDSSLLNELVVFLDKNYSAGKTLSIEKDSIGSYLERYIKGKRLYTTDGLGKTGRLYDLLVWENEKDTTYSFKEGDETISSRVVFMDDFITLGWEEYATLGKYYPGGWTTQDALYCVKKAYDLHSEDFLISYLAHEGRHFADYKLFPKLQSPDLEYRAKLTELSMAKETLYDLLGFFIANANGDSENGHSFADYCVIRDLSKQLFDVVLEKDISKWKQAGTDKINKAAYTVLKANSDALQHIGPGVERYIKK